MHADIFYDIRLDDVTYTNSMISLPLAIIAMKWESGNVLQIASEVWTSKRASCGKSLENKYLTGKEFITESPAEMWRVGLDQWIYNFQD